MVRRAAATRPEAVPLAFDSPSVLATGPGLKVTACLTRGSEAFLSQHIGDLGNASSCEALELAVKHLEAVLEITPELVAHDLHPDFFSTRLAHRIELERGIPAYAVQHHRAHIGAVMAEYGITGPARGIALDGVGLGTDGKAWGGEMLHLTPTASPAKRICSLSRFLAATARRVNPGAWPPLFSKLWGGETKSLSGSVKYRIQA